MSLISAGSILLDSTFKSCLWDHYFAQCRARGSGTCGASSSLRGRRSGTGLLPASHHSSPSSLWWAPNIFCQECIQDQSVADPGCLSRILDPNFFHPGSKFFPSRIRIKELKYFIPKNYFQAPGNMIGVVHARSGSWFFQIGGQKGPGSATLQDQICIYSNLLLLSESRLWYFSRHAFILKSVYAVVRS